MLWSLFKTTVKDLLLVDKNRQGATGFIDTQIQMAVIDLQEMIPQLRIGNETLYLPGDFAQEGSADRAVLPPNCYPREAYLVKCFDDGHADRHPCDQIDYQKRFELVEGVYPVNDNRGVIAIDPQSYTFYAYPHLTDGWLLSLFWDGQKYDFLDDEQVPFELDVANAVSLYVKAMLQKHVQKDGEQYDLFMGRSPAPEHSPPGTYLGERRKLHRKLYEMGALKL